MDQTQENVSASVGAPVEDPSVTNGAGNKYPPSRTRGLRPPWRSGASGNPSGLTKDGRAPKVAKLEAALLSELERSGGMSALAKRWVMLAKKGNSTALASILERLYPVAKDESAGRIILEGLKLELTPGGGASVTVARQEGPTGSLSFAGSEDQESRRGGSETGISESSELSAQALPGPGVLPALGTPEGSVGPTQAGLEVGERASECPGGVKNEGGQGNE